MKIHRLRSWSQRARRIAKNYIEVTIYNYENYGIAEGQAFEKEVIDSLNHSYRNPLIVRRAAGIYGRKIREYKAKKNI